MPPVPSLLAGDGRLAARRRRRPVRGAGGQPGGRDGPAAGTAAAAAARPVQLRVLRAAVRRQPQPAWPPVEAHRREGLRVRDVRRGVRAQQPAVEAPQDAPPPGRQRAAAAAAAGGGAAAKTVTRLSVDSIYIL